MLFAAIEVDFIKLFLLFLWSWYCVCSSSFLGFRILISDPQDEKNLAQDLLQRIPPLTQGCFRDVSQMLFSVHASGFLVPQGRKESVDSLTTKLCAKEIKSKGPASSTYSLVHVDGILAGDNVGDGRTSLLAGGLDGAGHFWNRKNRKCQ
jgi:hypothetical protein